MRLEGVAELNADMASDAVKEAEAALEAAKVKHARAVDEHAIAEKEAECFRQCVTEENCETCHVKA